MNEALKHFALVGKSPRQGQEIVINAIEEAFKTKDTVILEAPVGSGKSAIAMTLANWLGGSHILTPRKSLQDQYYNDFTQMSCVMKGKGGYPCFPRLDHIGPARQIDKAWEYDLETVDDSESSYKRIIQDIERRIPVFHKPEVGCDEGPCSGSSSKKKNCTLGGERPCPYNVAFDVALQSPHVIHNVHSFFFQNKFSPIPFEERNLIVIDECHDLETIVRGFLQTKLSVLYSEIPEENPPSRDAHIEEWVLWFLKTKGISTLILGIDSITGPDALLQALESYYTSRGRWVKDDGRKITSTPEKVFSENLAKALDIYSGMNPKDYIISTVDNKEKRRKEFTFTPLTLRGRPESLYLSYGKKRLLMSGTIYNKTEYCRNIGLDPEKVEFITINSEFPVQNRPIFAYKDLMTDNSYASWNKNDTAFEQMIRNIKKIMKTYENKKGLIHAPSYFVAEQIAAALQDKRIVTHSANNFLSVLDDFCGDTESNDVLISPICQQGVDFKGDIARFQIIVRVPYLSTEDEFVDHMREKNFPWYNYQSLIVFGQMIGRVVRSSDDWGHTYLLDSRFISYLERNRKILQPWLLKAIQYR